jgi:polyisoprenoid-binding protein YceI
MKKILLVIAVLFSTNSFAADKYVFDKAHTNIVWHANHFNYSHPNGQFTGFDGFFILDKEKPENSKVEAKVETASLWTSTEKFTEHLKSKDFFNVAEFPEAKFVSTKVEKLSDTTAKVTGDLTILGITKPLVLNVKMNALGKHPYTQKQTAGFTIDGEIKRSDYGMVYAIPGVADVVKLTIETEGILEADNNEQMAK